MFGNNFGFEMGDKKIEVVNPTLFRSGYDPKNDVYYETLTLSEIKERYGRVLSLEEIRKIEDYLIKKYNIEYERENVDNNFDSERGRGNITGTR